MAENVNLEVLSTRNGFNSAVRHIKKTIEISTESGKNNLSDVLYMLEDEEMSGERIALLLRMLLIEKLGYRAASKNLNTVIDDPSKLAQEFEKWKGVDLIAAYQHPELGLLIANPKVAEEIASFGQLKKRELIVVYAGLQGKETNEDCLKAAKTALNMFEGKKAPPPASMLKGNFTLKRMAKPQKEEPKPKAQKTSAAKSKTVAKKPPEAKRVAAPVVTAAAPSVKTGSGPVKMTPRYAVVVRNELFHNGNVEAWKKIVASYKAKHPSLEVYIYYDGERILDINSLFKWGKVKHGSAIEFAVAGNDIQNVAKLQRYLAQGASNMFEAFLRGPVNSVLNLF
jgi:hypothetical protein